MNKLRLFFKHLDYPVSNQGFGLFRILFAIYLLVFLSQVKFFQPLVFNVITGITPIIFPANLFLLIWFTSVVLLLIGFKTKFAALANYICVLLATYIFINRGFSTFNDDFLRIGSLLLVVFPTHKSLSLDSTLLKLINGVGYPKITSRLYYVAALFVSLGLIYWSSSLTKLFSPLWLKGLGFWTPAVMPHNKWNDLDLFLNNQWLMYAVNWITIVWEFAFIVAPFSKKHIRFWAFSGIIFHLAIAALFPFWLFCFSPLPFYVLFFYNTNFIKRHAFPAIVYFNAKDKKQLVLSRFITLLNPKISAYNHDLVNIKYEGKFYASNWDACKALLSKNNRGKFLWFFLQFKLFKRLALWIVQDVLVIVPYHSHTAKTRIISRKFKNSLLILSCFLIFLIQSFYCVRYIVNHHNKKYSTHDLTIKKFFVRNNTKDKSTNIQNLPRIFMGITARSLFLDHSFIGSRVVFAVTYNDTAGKQIWLPFYGPKGYTGLYNSNQMWSLFNKSVGGGTIPNPFELEKFLRFWMHKNNVSTRSMEFTVLKRIHHFPTHFEPDYLQKQVNLPWITEGKASFKQNVYSYIPIDSVENQEK